MTTAPTPAIKKMATVPSFAVGDEAAKRINGKIVGVIVSVNVSHKNISREGDAAIPIYEVPLMRRMYEREGGTLVIRPNWVPSIPRHRVLTDALFDDRNPEERDAIGELPRLRKTYLLRNSQTPYDIMAEVYGPTRADQARNLQQGMKDIFKAWTELYARKQAEVLAKRPDIQEEVLSLFPADEDVTVAVYQATLDAWMLELTGLEITTNEIEAIVDLVDPKSKGLEEYILPGLDDTKPMRARLVGANDQPIMRKASPVIGQDASLDAPYTGKVIDAGGMEDALGAGHLIPEPTEPIVNPGEGGGEDDLTISERMEAALKEKGYDETAAMEIATLALDHPDLPDHVLEHVSALKKHKGKYAAVRRVVAQFAVKA